MSYNIKGGTGNYPLPGKAPNQAKPLGCRSR